MELHGVHLYKTLFRDKKLHTSVPPRNLCLLGDEKYISEKCDLIRLYLNIRSLVPKFLAREVFSPSRFNLLVSAMVFTAISCDMVQILDSMSAVTPLDCQRLCNRSQSTPRLYLLMSYLNPPKIAHNRPCWPLWSQLPWQTWKIPCDQTVRHLIESHPVAHWWRPRLSARRQYQVSSIEC